MINASLAESLLRQGVAVLAKKSQLMVISLNPSHVLQEQAFIKDHTDPGIWHSLPWADPELTAAGHRGNPSHPLSIWPGAFFALRWTGLEDAILGVLTTRNSGSYFDCLRSHAWVGASGWFSR